MLVFYSLIRSTWASSIGSHGLSKTALLKSIKRVPLHSTHESSIPYSVSSHSASNTDEWFEDGCDELYHASNMDQNNPVILCSATTASAPINPVLNNLLRGAFLRVASDISGGTALENIKCRVATSGDNPFKATKDIINKPGGVLNLWSGTPTRIIEGALLGAVFLSASTVTKRQMVRLGGGKHLSALAGGIVGGVAQAVIMTPAGMVFTNLNVNKGKKEFENDNAFTVAQRIIEEKGVLGMYAGYRPMALRQASNWASRGLFTELCRTNLKLSRYGILGEVGSGAIGGIGSCWNTPIETVRVLMQRDVGMGIQPKSFNGYISQELEIGGIPALYKGVSPRSLQAIWQTVFMVVVPNIMGL